MHDATTLVPDDLIERLVAHADAADTFMAWPAASWEAVVQSGVLKWTIPREFDGDELEAREIFQGYERLGSACLTTAFILSQRDAAVRRIRDLGSPELRRELLRPLACGGHFATVGISQLTTSRQHAGPALRATPVDGGYTLDGSMPWVTAADQAHHLVAGAVLEDGRQLLVVVPGDASGVTVGPPLALAALSGSRTTEVFCRNVHVANRMVLAGPTERVMSSGRGGTGGLETSCLAVGLAGAAIDYLRHAATTRPEWESLAIRFQAVRDELRHDLFRLAEGTTADAALALRARANTLVLRATQAALTASKGAGFVHPHPAQRWARQALFFLVWSCPRPAIEATLESLNPE